MKDFIVKGIWEWRFVIAVIVAIAVYALLEWNKFKVQAYALMLQAKSLAKDALLKTGEEQVKWVVERSYVFLPKYITLFIPKSYMEEIIFYLYNKSKDYLDDGKINNSIK